MQPRLALLTSALPWTTLFLNGCLGGLCVETLKHVRKLEGRRFPSTFELGASIVLILLGGLVAFFYQGQVESIMIAAQIGATAPAIVGAWASGAKPPRNDGGGGLHKKSVGETVALPKERIESRIIGALSWRT